MEHMTARQSLLTSGYAHIPDVFTAGEIASLRATIQQHLSDHNRGIPSSFGRVEPLGVLEIPELRALIADRRVIDLVSELLSTPEPEFLLHCDAHRNDRSGWHKDTGEAVVSDGYFGRPVFHLDECLVVKLAIYCEDHVDDDGGLHVKPGSHHDPAVAGGEERAINTRIGDVVAFDVRITHMGAREVFRHRAMTALKLRLPSKFQRQAGRVFTATEEVLFSRTERTSLFFSFGAKDVEPDLTQRFARTNWERACFQARRDFDVPDSVIKELSLLNVDVVDF
jgi:hypothetical protein